MLKKSEQLQIRVSGRAKRAIMKAARSQGIGMSEYVLRKVLPPAGAQFTELVRALYRQEADPSYVLAEISSFLSKLSVGEFHEAVSDWPDVKLSDYLMNYLAAMIELTAHQKGTFPPEWVQEIEPLREPSFGCELQSLRFYLLTHAPIPFRRRNIFIDATLGARV